MHANSFLALSGVFAAVAAVPFAGQHYRLEHHHRRELVWKTVTEEVIQTIPVTRTVWLEPGETPPAAAVKPAEFIAPQGPAHTPKPSPVAPAYSAPAPSSPASSPAPPAYTPPAYSPPASSPAPPPYTPPVQSSPAPPAYTPPTSSYVPPPAPVTPSSSYVAPAPPASSAPSTGGSAGGYSQGMAAHGTEYTGEFTWYDPSIGYNACGTICGADEHVVAVSHLIWESYGTVNTNLSPLCNATVTITGSDGSAYTARVVDKCPSCAEGNLDLTHALFTLTTGESDGRIPGMKWQFD